MNYKPSILVLYFFVVVNSLFAIISYNKQQKSRVIVVESERLFNEFKMTKEVKNKGASTLSIFNSTLDSLQMQLSTADNERLKTELTKQIIEKRQALDDFNTHFISEESLKIWNRINDYTRDYARLKGYHAILGARKNGDVFFIEEDLDITDDLLKYINKRYEGFN